MKRHLLAAILLIGLLAAGCGPRQAPTPADLLPTWQDPVLPVTGAAQSVNLTAEDSWQIAHELLHRRGLGIEAADPGMGLIRTSWKSLSDTMCGAYPRSNVSLSCRVQYTIKIAPLTPVASSFEIAYLQQCEDQEQLTLECPDSNAERVMLGIIDELRRQAGVITR